MKKKNCFCSEKSSTREKCQPFKMALKGSVSLAIKGKNCFTPFQLGCPGWRCESLRSFCTLKTRGNMAVSLMPLGQGRQITHCWPCCSTLPPAVQPKSVQGLTLLPRDTCPACNVPENTATSRASFPVSITEVLINYNFRFT